MVEWKRREFRCSHGFLPPLCPWCHPGAKGKRGGKLNPDTHHHTALKKPPAKVTVEDDEDEREERVPDPEPEEHDDEPDPEAAD